MNHVNKKAVLIALVAFLFALGGFLYFLSGNKPATGAITEIEGTPLSNILGRELLMTLTKLRSTSLDASVFLEPVFVSLHDFSVKIPSQPVGRRNPFAAFPGLAGAASTPSSVQSAGASSPARTAPPTSTGSSVKKSTGQTSGTVRLPSTPPSSAPSSEEDFDDFGDSGFDLD